MRGGSSFRRVGNSCWSFGGSRGGRRHAASGAAGSAPPAAQQPRSALLQALQSPVVKAMFTSASLSATGDLIAQTFEHTQRSKAARAENAPAYDLTRTGRLGLFGLTYYGPLQHFWYGFLNRKFPTPMTLPLASRLSGYAAKVVANQLVLGPIVVSSIFAWSLAWQRRLSDYPAKWRRDTLPTLKKGWLFWVPAATVNFMVIPVQYQVLYMSGCGLVWTTILSAATSGKQ